MYNGDGLFERCFPRGLGERSLGTSFTATGDGKVFAVGCCFGTSAGAGWGVAFGRGDGADGTVSPFRDAGTTGIGEDNVVGAVSLSDSGSGTGVDSSLATGGEGTKVVEDFTGVDVLSGAYPGPGTADLTWGAG